MDIALYTSDRGVHLLVPACMQPAARAETLYGPLRLCAITQLARLRDFGVRQRVEAEIDQHDYAVVTAEEGKTLLGARHACFRQPRPRFLARLRGPRGHAHPSGSI